MSEEERKAFEQWKQDMESRAMQHQELFSPGMIVALAFIFLLFLMVKSDQE